MGDGIFRRFRPIFRGTLIANVQMDAERGTRQNLLRMIAIKERLPDLIIVPAHDMRAFAEMPRLPSASGETRR